MRKLISLALVAAVVTAGCGGGKPAAFSQATSTTGVSGTTSTATVASLTLTTSSATILADGSTTATINALARDANNNLLPNIVVTFTASSGGIAGSPAKTNASGDAQVTLSTAGDSTLRTITVTGAVGSLTNTVTVQVVQGTTTTSVSMGSGTGANFVAGTLGIAVTSLSAGGSTSVNAVLQQSDGTLYTSTAPGVAVTFSSPCQANGLATITSPVNTATGIASATYSAKGCSGPDIITATATVNGNQLTATGTVNVAAAAIGSIVYVSATPTNVAIKGTGAAGHQETSTVVFQVLDTSGGPRAGATVNFALDTTVGGITLAPASGTTDANGHVQTVVQAGTVATAVRVTATVQGITPTISTQSSELTITTGIPTQNEFSLSVLPCPNIEAWSIDGQTVTVTVRMADRFSNPVPDGTAATFSSYGGKIGGQCTTATTATESGVCSVNWTSQAPRPGLDEPGTTGRSSILATAIGEESFVDANGNGEYDAGETFYDRAERFRDDMNTTGDDPDTDSGYVSGDFFYDFNNNGIRDPADGIFEGVLCTAGLPVCDPTKTSTGIGRRVLVIFSGSSAKAISQPPPVTVAANGTATLTYVLSDENGNPLPWDAAVSATTTGSIGSVTPSTIQVGCSTAVLGNGTAFTFTLAAGATAGTGTVQINVTTKSGTITPFSTSVTVQ